MKLHTVTILFVLTVVINAQRPGYVSGPVGFPDLAPRFRENTSTTPDIGNRLGESGTTSKIPVDARGDADLVNRLNNWPRPNRPFWILNAEHIERQRNPQGLPSVTTVRNNQPSTSISNTVNSVNPQQQLDLQQRFREENVSGNAVIPERRPSTAVRHEFTAGSLP